MSKLRLVAIFFIVSLVSFAPLLVNAAEPASFFGPIISEDCKCPGSAPGWGCILQTVQNVMNLAISLSVIIATLIIAYAGFLWILSPTNAENKQKGRTLLLNAVIGMVIVLSSWLFIDFLMKALYDESTFGPWNAILTGQSDAGYCLQAKNGNTILTSNTICTLPETTTTNSGTTGGSWSYDPGIAAQMSTASPELTSLLSCMRGKLPRGVGRISSISDSQIMSNSKTFAQCALSGCNHTSHSCHYGGYNKIGKSYAVDFGDEENTAILRAAAAACNPGARYIFEGNHVHISVGAASGAGCDAGMALAGNSAAATQNNAPVCTTTTVTTTTGVTTSTTNPTVVTNASSTTATSTPSNAPSVTFSSSASSVVKGGKVTLAWSSKNTTSCTGTGFDTGNKVSGSVTVSPTTTTTYGISCKGASGSTDSSKRIAVTATAQTWDPEKAVATIAAGAAANEAAADAAEATGDQGLINAALDNALQCAAWLRKALIGGGLTQFSSIIPPSAYLYDAGGYLVNAGFVNITQQVTGSARTKVTPAFSPQLPIYTPRVGDIAVLQPVCRAQSLTDADKKLLEAETNEDMKTAIQKRIKGDESCRSLRPNAPQGTLGIISHAHGHISIYKGGGIWISFREYEAYYSYDDYHWAGGEYAIFRHPEE